MNDGTLTADSAAAADGKRRSNRFDYGNHWSDNASIVVDGIHDLGDPVAFGFRCKVPHQEGHAHGAKHRNQDHQRPPGTCRRVGIGVIDYGKSAQKQCIVKKSDHAPKNHRPQAGDNPHHKRQQIERKTVERLP